LNAQTVAEAGHLVTFGISPSRPDTGYGYIRMGEPLPGHEGFRAAARFVEKPNRATAEQYLAEGGYVWNSGMFAFRAGTVLDELAEHAPEVYAALLTLEPDLEAGRPLSRAAYESVPKISIDYAVMERSRRVAVMAVDPGWSDLGGFEALLEILPADRAGNVVRLDPGGDAMVVESRGNLVWGGNKVVALVGMENTVVVDTDDALLVCARDQAQSVRDVAERLKVAGRSEASLHRTVHRPWGSYSLLEEGPGYKITRMHVKPGARLPLQRHNRRREHWVVVSGTAEVTQAEETCLLRKDESTSIPLGTPHRLENPGTVAAEVIVVQHGEYLGEDDTVLLEQDRTW
jgi:mannose-1-phosphate guanylyltransferase/mannose-6-phosphate isomerase